MAKRAPKLKLKGIFTRRQLWRAGRIWRRRQRREFRDQIYKHGGPGALHGLFAGLAWMLTNAIVLTLFPVWTFGFFDEAPGGLWWLTAFSWTIFPVFPCALAFGALIGWRLGIVSAKDAVYRRFSIAGTLWRSWIVRVLLLVFVMIMLAILEGMGLGVIFYREAEIELLTFVALLTSFLLESLIITVVLLLLLGKSAQAIIFLSSASSGRSSTPITWASVLLASLAVTSVWIILIFSAMPLTSIHERSENLYALYALALEAAIAFILFIAFVFAVVLMDGVQRNVLPFISFLKPSSPARNTTSTLLSVGCIVVGMIWFSGMYGLKDTIPLIADTRWVNVPSEGASEEIPVRFGPGVPDAAYLSLGARRADEDCRPFYVVRVATPADLEAATTSSGFSLIVEEKNVPRDDWAIVIPAPNARVNLKAHHSGVSRNDRYLRIATDAGCIESLSGQVPATVSVNRLLSIPLAFDATNQTWSGKIVGNPAPSLVVLARPVAVRWLHPSSDHDPTSGLVDLTAREIAGSDGSTKEVMAQLDPAAEMVAATGGSLSELSFRPAPLVEWSIEVGVDQGDSSKPQISEERREFSNEMELLMLITVIEPASNAGEAGLRNPKPLQGQSGSEAYIWHDLGTSSAPLGRSSTLWWKWRPPAAGRLTASTSKGDTYLKIYSVALDEWSLLEPDFSALTEENEETDFSVTPDKVYYFAVDGSWRRTRGSLTWAFRAN